MRRILTVLLTSALLAASIASAAKADGVGLAAPLSGFAAPLGEQMRAGALIAARDAGTRLVIADTGCTAEGGAAAASAFVEARVETAAGFLCVEAIEAALPILTRANIPVVTPGVRANGLTDNRQKTGWLVWRTGPRADAEGAAIAAILTERWRKELFAIVDDGTIHGRELAEGFRLAAELKSLKPVFTDTFRPQMDNQIALAGRLRKAGATHVFAGGDREDIAILARDAEKIGLGLIIAGGEGLTSAGGDVPLAPGVLMIGLPESAGAAPAALLARFRAAGVEPEGYVLPAYAAIEIAAEAAKRTTAGAAGWNASFSAAPFVTATGNVTFNANGDRDEPPYRLFEWTGETFVETD